MQELRHLLAILIFHAHNIHCLHWKTIDANFLGNHKFLDETYSQMTDDIDLIAEIGMQNDVEPLTLSEAIDMMNSDEKTHLVVNSEEYYNGKQTFETLKTILEDVISDTELVLENGEGQLLRGQISDIENMERYYSLISRYKIKNILKEISE